MKAYLMTATLALAVTISPAAFAQSSGAGSIGGAGGPGLGGGEIRGNTGPGMLGSGTRSGAVNSTSPQAGAGIGSIPNGSLGPSPNQNPGPPTAVPSAPPPLPDIDTGCGINHGFGLPRSPTGGC